MRGLLCKIWNFLLNIFTDLVSAVASAIAVVGTAIVDVLSEVASAVGDALGLSGSTVVWLGVGIFAYWFISKKKDEPTTNSKKSDANAGKGVINV